MEQLNNKSKNIIYCVERDSSMRLIKEISYKRARQLSEYEKAKSLFNEIKKNNPKSIIAKANNISNLKFYIVIDSKNLFDKNNYFKFFFEKDFLDAKKFQEEHKKFIENIKEKTTKEKKHLPKFFKKLGKTNEVKGCYLVITNKVSKPYITITNSLNTISVRFKYKKLLIRNFKYV